MQNPNVRTDEGFAVKDEVRLKLAVIPTQNNNLDAVH
jgi:hypothetical protein